MSSESSTSFYQHIFGGQPESVKRTRKFRVQLVDYTRPALSTQSHWEPSKFFTINFELDPEIGDTFGHVWAEYPSKMLRLEDSVKPIVDLDMRLNSMGLNKFIMCDWSPEYEHLGSELVRIGRRIYVKKCEQALRDTEESIKKQQKFIHDAQTELTRLLVIKEREIQAVHEARKMELQNLLVHMKK